MSIEAMKRWLASFEGYRRELNDGQPCDAEKELRQAIEQAEQEQQVTVLPDGSAFAVMSWPLPKNHWLYADRQYNEWEYEPVELGKPILTHELRDAVVSAVRYAIRGATNCGKDVDFDPDALVQNAVYALCGPYGHAIKQAEQAQPVAHSLMCVCGAVWDIKPDGGEEMVHTPDAQPASKPVAWRYNLKHRGSFEGVSTEYSPVKLSIGENWTPLYTDPPPRKPLTDEDIKELYGDDDNFRMTKKYVVAFARAIEAACTKGEA